MALSEQARAVLCDPTIRPRGVIVTALLWPYWFWQHVWHWYALRQLWHSIPLRYVARVCWMRVRYRML